MEYPPNKSADLPIRCRGDGQPTAEREWSADVLRAGILFFFRAIRTKTLSDHEIKLNKVIGTNI